MRLCNDEKAIFSGVARPCENIFCVLAGTKCEFVVFEKVKYQGDAWV
jgi:uncharacterized membrane protein